MNQPKFKSVATIALAAITLMPLSAEAQLLKGIKDKIKQTKEAITGTTKKHSGDKKKDDKKQPESNTSFSSSGRDEVAKHVKGPHFGNLVDAYSLETEGKQFYSSSTPVIEIDNGQWDASDYHDGVAYIRTWLNGNFFVDKTGNKLFETKAEPQGDFMPQFENGYVILMPDKHVAEIREKKGNLIKSFDKVYGISNFRDGVACIVFIEKDAKGMQKYHLKYVNTNGTPVYPDLWYICETLPYPKGVYSVDELMRDEYEGLTAYPMQVASNGLSKIIKWGYHSKGKKVIEPTYDVVGDFHEGLAAFGNEIRDNQYKFGFLDKTGKVAIPAKYSNPPSDFNSGYSKVLDTKNHAYLIDKTGAQRLGPANRYADDEEEGVLTYISAFAGGYGLIGENHESNDGIYRTYFFIIDKDFNKKAYFYLENLQSENRNDFLKYIDGNYYIFDGITRGGKLQINPETADIIGVPKSAFMSEGVYLDEQQFDAKPGFRDKNGNYTLMLLNSEF